MAAQGASVLAELGGGWLQCQDAQGIFYFNSVTQQSSDVLPPELGGVAPQVQPQQLVQPQPQMQYLQPQVAQAQPQVQYMQPQTAQAQPQVQYLQPQIAQAQPQIQYVQQGQAQQQFQYLQSQPQVQYAQQPQLQMQMAQPQPQVQYMQASQAQKPVQYIQQAQAQPQTQYFQQAQEPSYQPQPQTIQQQAQPQQAQSNVKLEVGDWLVCEDAQGEFYFHKPTQSSFDQAPPELIEIIKATQAQPNLMAQQVYGQQLAGNVQYVQYGN